MSNDPHQSQEPPYDQPFYEYTSTAEHPIGYGQPPYGDRPSIFPYPPVPQKTSHRRLWITLGIVGSLLVLLVCGGCVAASAFGFRYIQQHIGPVLVSTQYYEALKEQKYDLAYNYVDANAIIQGQHVSLAIFTRQAQTADTTRGKVTRSTPVTFSGTTSTTIVTMQVTRNRQTYLVTLQLKREGNDWRITNANRI